MGIVEVNWNYRYPLVIVRGDFLIFAGRKAVDKPIMSIYRITKSRALMRKIMKVQSTGHTSARSFHELTVMYTLIQGTTLTPAH